MADQNRLKAVLWDFDGILMDTQRLHFDIWKQVLQEHGVPLAHEKFLTTFGQKNEEFLPLLFGRPLEPAFVTRLGKDKEQRFRQAAAGGQVKLLPGVLAWLERFRQMGLEQAVASSAPPENVQALLAPTSILPYFAALVSSDGLPGKPDPAIFLQAAARLRLLPAQCLVIEDSLSGIEAARRAGMRCLAVANTYPIQQLSAADLAVEALDRLAPEQLTQLIYGLDS